ncbi:MAG: hypothetical protein CM15mP84_01280 [Cellvibrionales bacterium]|nr:MAG: hypothetical protein CM15mP84_01280 [Cellvibrionales bacterium]
MDILGNKEARVYVSAVKAMVPEKSVKLSTKQFRCMAHRYVALDSSCEHVCESKAFAFADGPDEVHHMVVGRNEVRHHDL